MNKEAYWNSIPIGEANAITYEQLVELWGVNERSVRKILHTLSSEDNSDDYILIRSGHGKGFYRTDDARKIEAYKNECLKKGRSVLAPLKKINRVLSSSEDAQCSVFNNLRAARIGMGLKQKQVCKQMRQFDKSFDVATLSKLENGLYLPTPYQLQKLASILRCEPSELLSVDLYSNLSNV